MVAVGMAREHSDHPHGSKDPECARGDEKARRPSAAHLGIALERAHDSGADAFANLARCLVTLHRATASAERRLG